MHFHHNYARWESKIIEKEVKVLSFKFSEYERIESYEFRNDFFRIRGCQLTAKAYQIKVFPSYSYSVEDEKSCLKTSVKIMAKSNQYRFVFITWICKMKCRLYTDLFVLFLQ